MFTGYDLTGQKFGMLTVLCRGESTKHNIWRWWCRCDCGELRLVEGRGLRKGLTRSCGCFQRENTSLIHTQHGYANKERLYHTWRGMIRRTTWEGSPDYKHYGGRGIKVCDEWAKDYEAFRKWAMANGYYDNLTIDRIDVNGDYKPDNCRWVTQKKQTRNKRTNRILTYKGETMCVADWSDRIGTPSYVLYARIHRHPEASDEEILFGDWSKKKRSRASA